MTVTFYPFESQSDGYHTQTSNPSHTKQMSYEEIINEMSTPILQSKKEFFYNTSHDILGKPLKTFFLLSNTHKMKISRK